MDPIDSCGTDSTTYERSTHRIPSNSNLRKNFKRGSSGLFLLVFFSFSSFSHDCVLTTVSLVSLEVV